MWVFVMAHDNTANVIYRARWPKSNVKQFYLQQIRCIQNSNLFSIFISIFCIHILSHQLKCNLFNYIFYRNFNLKYYIQEKVQYFCHSFQKVKPIYYIDSLHNIVKYFKPLFIEILMIIKITLHIMRTQMSVFQKIRKLYKIIKKGIF